MWMNLKTAVKRVPVIRGVFYRLRWSYNSTVLALGKSCPPYAGISNRRVTFTRPNKISLVVEKVPKPRNDEVLIKTECSLISSGTETTCLRGIFPVQSHWGKWVNYPWYPGYQNIGYVVKVGSAVEGLKVGQRVASHSSHSQFVVAPARRCILVPERLSSEEAAWFALSAVAQIALAKCKLSKVRRAAVIGLGPLGQLTAQWLRVLGIGEVLPIGRSPWRVEFAKTRLGNSAADAGSAIQLTIDAAGTRDALLQAFQITEDYGTIILIGDSPDPSQQRLTSDLLVRGLTLIGAHSTHASFDDPPSNASMLTHAELAASFFESVSERKLDVSSMITHRFSPDSVTLAYKLAARRESGTMGVLFDWKQLDD
jgi:2-desacetyl-2-hydroxyethyl bacteriochlorophyllide A dehydrogenase